jgi:hypothetical protein
MLDFVSTTPLFKTILYLVFANFYDIIVAVANLDLFVPDICHPPLVINFSVFTVFSQSLDYAMLYKILSSNDWSYIYKHSSTDFC